MKFIILFVTLTCLIMLISLGNAQTAEFPDSDGAAGDAAAAEPGADAAEGDAAAAEPAADTAEGDAAAGEPAADGGLGGKAQDADAELNPEQQGCFQSFYDNNMGPCLQELTKGHETNNVTINSECCGYLTSIDSSCVSVVHFKDPKYQAKVQEHCTTAAGPTAADADADAPVGQPGGRKSMPSFPDPAYGPAPETSADAPSAAKLGSAADSDDPAADSTPAADASDAEEDKPAAEDAAPATEEEAPAAEEEKAAAEEEKAAEEDKAAAEEDTPAAEGK